MGNAKVTPAAPTTSHNPVIPTTYPSFRTPVPGFFTEVPTRSPTPYIPLNSPISSLPRIPSNASTSPEHVAPTTVQVPEVPTMPAPSPTFAIPIVSPNLPIPVISPVPPIPVVSSIHTLSPIPPIPIVAPNPMMATASSNLVNPTVSPGSATSVTSPRSSIPTVSPNPTVPVVTPHFSIPVLSPNPAIPVILPNSAVPVFSPNFAMTVASPTTAILLASPTVESPKESSPPVVPHTSLSPEDLVISRVDEVPAQSSTHETPVNFPFSHARVTSSVAEVPVKSPTHETPVDFPFSHARVTSSVAEVPVQASTHETPVNFPISQARAASSVVEVPVQSPTHEVTIKSPTTDTPIKSPVAEEVAVKTVMPENPTIFQTATFPIHSTTPSNRVLASTPVIPVRSPTPEISPISSPPPPPPPPRSHAPPVPVTHLITTSSEIPIASPVLTTKSVPVLSPDTSAVSPTFDLPTSPIRVPFPVKNIVPTKSIQSPPKFRPIVPITYDAATSPIIPPKPEPRVIPTTFHPPKVAIKRPITKSSMPPPPSLLFKQAKTIPSSSSYKQSKTTPSSSYKPLKTTAPSFKPLKTTASTFKPSKPSTTSIKQPKTAASSAKQSKPSTSSSSEHWSKPNKFEPEPQEPPKPSTYITQYIQTRNNTSTSSKSTDIDQEITSDSPDVIAVPSFPLRSTAVYNPLQDDPMLSERTQSIHPSLSIFQYNLIRNGPKQEAGGHIRATMFKMDTRLRYTPFPTPSLSLLTKNFNDGTDETNEHTTFAPSFGSLGLENNHESDGFDQRSIERRLEQKQKQRKFIQSSLILYENSENIPSSQFISSVPNLSAIEKTSLKNNRQPIASTLKKPSTQYENDSFFPKTTHQSYQELQKNDFEGSPYAVSLNIPSRITKAYQSITRSEMLIRGKKYN